MKSSFRSRWLRRPQDVWLRRALFQVHLWTGIIIGLYVVVVSVTGSAVVFRREMEEYLIQRSRLPDPTPALTREQLNDAARRAYPGEIIQSVTSGRFANESPEVVLLRSGSEVKRVFNPYTARDLGTSPADAFRWIRITGDMHGSLLLGPAGMRVNGIGGALLALLCFTGLIIWWPGISKWRRSLSVRRKVGWKKFTWDLHSAVGFWTFGLLLMWGLTGAYFPFPEPFRAVINVFTTIDPPRRPIVAARPAPGATVVQAAPSFGRRPRRPQTTGQKILRSFSLAHYGNFAGWPVKALWVLLGLVPPFLFVTGALMWWNRVLRPFALRLRRRPIREPVPALD
jgi:uncharacterized iron-regulated membrane protein